MSTENETEKFIGYNEPNTRGLVQDLHRPFTNCTGVNLTDAELEIVMLGLMRLHDLEDLAWRRDWEAVAAYCPRVDDPDE